MLAIEQDRPGAVLISMPRSASGFLTHGLSHAARVPVLRITVGEGLYSVPVPRWVRQVARGSATTHEHIAPAAINLAALREGGLRDAWIQVRDPRDAAFSSLVMEGPIGFEPSPAFQGEQGFLSLSTTLATWIDGWMTAAQDPACGFKIHFLRFEEVTSDLPSAIRRILAERCTPEIAERAQGYLGRRVPINFRKGTGQEWRSRFSPDACEQAWEAIPPKVRSFLDLER
jgi:hypothetical protein